MKVVQLGILIALLVVGVLLFKVYQGQQTQTAPVPPQEQAQTTAPAEQPQATASPAPAEPSAKPSPSAWKPAPSTQTRKPASTPAAQMAPASSNAPEPAPTPAPAASEPAPEPRQPVAPAPIPPRKVTIDAGTLFSVRLAETLQSDRMQAGDSFQATLDKPLVVDGLVIAERGARLDGRVAEVTESGRVKGLAALSIELTRLHTSDGQTVNIQTQSFRKEAEKSTKGDAAKVGIGAGIGAAIGAIAGGGKGAAIGAGAGGAAGTGAVLMTRGKAAVLPTETRIDFKLSAPVTITEKRN